MVSQGRPEVNRSIIFTFQVTKWAKVRNCIKRCGANPASNEPLPLSAIPIVYVGDTSDLIAELRANYVQASMYRYPRVVTGTGTHFPIM